MRFVILGAGAIGSLFGAYLADAGREVVLIETPGPRAEHLEAHGIRMQTPDGERVEVKPPVYTDSQTLGAADVLLICVKSYHTRQALGGHRGLIGPKTLVLSLQNGIGNIEAISESIAKERVLGGSTTMGGYIDESGVLHHAGRGDTLIGELSGKIGPHATRVAEAMTTERITVSPAAGIRGVLFTKLAVNCAINPLTALLRKPNGVLLDSPDLKAAMCRIVAEVAAVAEAEGVPLDPDSLYDRTLDVAQKTAANRSSMLKDIETGRRTEIDAISGAVADLGALHDIDTPLNLILAGLVRALEG